MFQPSITLILPPGRPKPRKQQVKAVNLGHAAVQRGGGPRPDGSLHTSVTQLHILYTIAFHTCAAQIPFYWVIYQTFFQFS